jgi:MerR family regulatory protein
MSIGEASDRTGLTPHTPRYYEREGRLADIGGRIGRRLRKQVAVGGRPQAGSIDHSLAWAARSRRWSAAC